MAENSQGLVRRRPVFAGRGSLLTPRGSLFEVYARPSVPRVTETSLQRVTESGQVRVIERRAH